MQVQPLSLVVMLNSQNSSFQQKTYTQPTHQPSQDQPTHLQEDQQQHGESLISLTSNLQEHREEHGKQLRCTSNEAQKDLLENLSKTNATWSLNDCLAILRVCDLFWMVSSRDPFIGCW